MYVSHPLIKPDSIESRAYQESILATALNKNVLCVLPTGLGKTPIAVLLAANRLAENQNSRILVAAPTRPLVSQHYKSFLNFLNIDEALFALITGIINPGKREEIYKNKKIIFATPQTIENDLQEARLNLKDFSLLVLDEVHHAIGNYAYPFIAKKYLEQAANPRILGLTASPGGDAGKIEEICKNTGLDAVEIRTEEDEDVRPYIKEKEIEWVNVDLPENFGNIRALLKSAYLNRIETLGKMWLVKRKNPAKKDLLLLQNSLMAKIKAGNKNAFIGLSVVLPAIKLEHAIGLVETQGIPMLESYWKKLRSEESKYTKSLLNDKAVSNAMFLTNKLFGEGYKHPKMSKLCSIVSAELNQKSAKIIVFATYRETVGQIASALGKIEGARPVEFIGQGNRGTKKLSENKQEKKKLNTDFQKAADMQVPYKPIQELKKGLTQKEQLQRLEDFKSGIYNILICTSIGEEGLHVADADLAIFYEPAASEIRSIQRRGRVGRSKIGKIIVLITKSTRDEAYHWASINKERRMKGILYSLQNKMAK